VSKRGFKLRVDLGKRPPKEICYLFHLDPPLEHAKHYLGTSEDFETRDSKHGTSQGARLLQVQRERGGSWHLVRTWRGGRRKERQLKSNPGTRYCPDCTDHPLEGKGRPGSKYLTRKQRADRQAQLKESPLRDAAYEGLDMFGRQIQPMTEEQWERSCEATERLVAGWRQEIAERQIEREAG
jgi:hypothetical protein